jgi:hypothetical protein
MYHLLRLSKTLREGLLVEDAMKSMEWNLKLFQEDEIIKISCISLEHQ